MDKIAVEVKSFLNASILQDIEEALGQYIVYLSFLKRSEPERKLYLAVSDIAYTLFKKSEAIQMLLSDHHVSLIVVNTERQEIVTWIQN